MMAAAVHPGQAICIGPHDVYRDRPRPLHFDTPPMTVIVDPDRPPFFPFGGTVVVIYWVSLTGRPCGVFVCDRDDWVDAA